MSESPALYGIMAEFSDELSLLEAAKAAHARGYRKMDAYSPVPVEGLAEAIGFDNPRQPAITLCGGLTGLTIGYTFQYWVSAIAYPLNVGGRPLHSWVSFIVPSYELTILFAAFSTVIGLIILCGFPQPYHPVFNVPAFDKASQSGFFLCIESRDPKFDGNEVRAFLKSQHALGVHDVAP